MPGYGYPPYPPPPPYGYTPGPPVDVLGRPLAEWWKRLVAHLLDGLLTTAAMVVAAIPVVLIAVTQLEIDSDTGEVTKGLVPVVLAAAGWFVIVTAGGFAYYSLMNGSSRGQTLGKRVLKIQVRDVATGGPIGIGRGFMRYLVEWLLASFGSGVGTLLDGLWPLWDPWRQALHDKAANSVVIDVGDAS